MGLDHRKGPGSCVLPKYVSDHPYWGQIGLGWSVQESMTYVIFLSFISFWDWAIVQSPSLLGED